ncbi:MAG TPA: hypothetical protein VGF97_06620 [Rhizomicrobium sp.]|jgi:hypothetical protein
MAGDHEQQGQHVRPELAAQGECLWTHTVRTAAIGGTMRGGNFSRTGHRPRAAHAMFARDGNAKQKSPQDKLRALKFWCEAGLYQLLSVLD